MDWNTLTKAFQDWNGESDAMREAVLGAGGQWSDNTGGGIPVGFITLPNGEVATVGVDSLLRWPRGAYADLDEYLADGDPGEPSGAVYAG